MEIVVYAVIAVALAGVAIFIFTGTGGADEENRRRGSK